MTNIASALAVLETHLVNAGAALTTPLQDVKRGLPTGGRSIRYYWAGEVAPPKMGGPLVLNGQMVGERFAIAALWPLSNLTPETVTAIDTEMQTLAGEIRTRIQGDSQLGGNVVDMDLGYGTPDVLIVNGARHVALRWEIDLSYVEYTIAP